MERNNSNRRRRMLLAGAAGLATELASGNVMAEGAADVQPGAYRVVLENEHLRVLEYRSRPGQNMCGLATHSHPAHLTIALSDAKVRVTLPDGRKIVVGNKLGDVFWSEAETHATETVGGAPARALVVELKTSKAKA